MPQPPGEVSPSDESAREEANRALFADLPLEGRIDELAGFLQIEEMVASHLVSTVVGFVREVNRDFRMDALDHDPVLKPEVWERHFDRTQPVLGIRRSGIANGGLLAMAAAQLREQGESICNVLLLPELAFGSEGHTDTEYFVSRGIIMDPKGNPYAGDLPEPVRIDAFPANGNEGVWDTPITTAYINPPAFERAAQDKSAIQTKMAQTGIPHVSALVSSVTAGDAELHSAVTSLMDAGEAIVIKPTAGSLGHNVMMVDPAHTSPKAVIDQLKARQQENPDAQYMLERWVQSHPLTHPKTGIPLDWNIRTYLTGGKSVGEYARVGNLGYPVNISRGANAKNLNDIFDACKLTSDARKFVLEQLGVMYGQVTDTFPEAGILGLDTIILPSLQPVLLEINAEHSGGLSNLITTNGGDMTPAHDAIRNLHSHLFRQTLRPAQPPHAVKSPTRVEDLVDALYFIEPDDDPELVLKLVHALPYLSADLPQDLRGRIENFRKPYILACHTEQATQQDIQNDIAVAAIEVQRRIADSTPNPYEPINAWTNVDPTNVLRQRAGANLFLGLAKIQDRDKVLKATLELPAQSAEDAEAMSRALLFSTLDLLGYNPTDLSAQTRTTLMETGIEFYKQAPETRHFPDIDRSKISPGETPLIAEIHTYITVFGHIVRRDYAHLVETIKTLKPEEPHDYAVLGHLNEYFNRYLVKLGEEDYAHFLTLLSLNKMPEAFWLLESMPPEYYPSAYEQTVQHFEQGITAAGVSADDPNYQPIIDTILATITAIYSDDLKEAGSNISSLNTLIAPYQSDQLQQISELLYRYSGIGLYMYGVGTAE